MDLSQLLLMRKVHGSFRPLVLAVLFILSVMVVGVVGYARFEGLEPFDSLYFTVVTLSTIGFGDIAPKTHAGKAFTIFFIPLGVSAFLYAFSAVSMAVFEGRLLEVFKLEQAKDEIKRMRGHVILCGYGDVGEHVAKGLRDVVVVENDKGRYEEVLRAGLPGVHGDSTRSETLREAGIDRARAVIIALNQDPKTVFTVLTIKELNPDIKIFARANRVENTGKIRTAGADHVICLPEIGGKELLKALGGGQG
jgi:voltage-gated potassium channel